MELREGTRGKNAPSNPGANLKSISHRCHLILVAFAWELAYETINLPPGWGDCGR